MEHLWIAESAGAALLQALRYAALKELNRHLSALVSTYTRVLFSFPLLALMTAIVLAATGTSLPALSWPFVLYSAAAAICQFLSSAMMIRLFQLGNFAVGTMLAKSDVILTALLGTAFFSEVISGLGWVAILLTVAGVLVISQARAPAGAFRQGGGGFVALVAGQATRWGLGIGLINAFAYLMLKEAMQVLEPGTLPVVRAVWAGCLMTFCSVVILGAWLVYAERGGLLAIRNHQGAGWLLGAFSAFGTLLWFLATVGSNASYVAAVAQVQIVFALLILRYWFKEAILPAELAGIATILAGVLLFKMV